MRLTKVMQEAVHCFKENGALIIELDEIMDREAGNHSFHVMLYEFKDGLNKYLQSMGPGAPVKNLEDLIVKTFADTIEMKYHDHRTLKSAQSKGDLNSEEYLIALDIMYKKSREEGIDNVMNEYELAAIISPAGGPAWKTDLSNGDNLGIYSYSPAAIAGYPNITVPMGHIDGLPVGLSIFGAPENGVDISIISAATLMSVAPLLIAFLIFQRQFVQAFLRAGIK